MVSRPRVEIRAVIHAARLLDHFGITHSRQGRKACVLLPPMDQRAPVQARIDARRRCRVPAYPVVQGIKQGTQHGAIVRGIVQVVGNAATRWIGSGPVLRAAEGVNPDLIGDNSVFLAQRVGVDQGAAAVPVLRRALRVHHPG